MVSISNILVILVMIMDAVLTFMVLEIDLTWWFDFVFNKLERVQIWTRELVQVLDARFFAKESYDFSSDQQERTLTRSWQRAVTLLPNVKAILLDGHVDIDHAALIGSRSDVLRLNHLRLLSIKDCSYHLPTVFFSTPHLQTLVYLDISRLPGSLSSLLHPGILPALRILKARDRELDDSALHALITHFGLRLWSLDVSNNKISDVSIQTLRDWCLPVSQLREIEHMLVEGKVIPHGGGTPDYGPFLSIQESDFSESFSHPERYFVDAPAYTKDVGASIQEHHIHRLDGSTMIRKDSADAAKDVLCHEDADHVRIDEYQTSNGTTHLRLSHNRISALGIQKLLRISNGHIEDLTCDDMPLLPNGGSYCKAWPSDVHLDGILGATSFFRPVFSSNLRVLRIHHSLVTNIPTLRAGGLSSLARVFLAETTILRRVDRAYPQTFIPDMNPRLISLTLTCLPRRSSGPLISRLVHFLKLLSTQERGIQDALANASTRHSPGILQGLRHLRLEFEADSMEDGFSASEDLDAQELMNSGGKVFSFFENERKENRSRASRLGSYSKRELNSKGVGEFNAVAGSHQASGSDRDNPEFVTYDGDWNGEPCSIQVWAGPRDSNASDVLKDYRRLVLERNIRDGVGPTTPTQVLAGAPPQSFIFHVAWSAAVVPPVLTPPTIDELAGMGDVLDVLKKYRLSGRASYVQHKKLAEMEGRFATLGEPHYFWTGRLEVSTEPTKPLSRPSQYWR